MADISTQTNPLRAGLRMQRTPEPCTMVIFGATGDLTHRKLAPALYNLHRERLLPPGFNVVGFARRDWSDDYFRESLKQEAQKYSRTGIEDPLWNSFAEGIFFNRAPFDDPAGYQALAQRLSELDEQRGAGGNRLFYLSTPPESYPEIIKQLGAAGLNHNRSGADADERGWTRIIIEKPFGHDLASARALNADVHKVFDESQVYRIDHYLGKETVQNIMVLRFANGIFEPIWNRRYVDHVQITVAETVGVEQRGGYYDEAGALRDMVPNHIFQLISLTAMEPPVSFEADAVRDEQAKVLRAIQPLSPEEVLSRSVRGQYGEGTLNGQRAPAYRSELRVAPDSRTETFVALKLNIDNWRWAGVPFYLRTGKRLPRRVSEIAIHFRRAPFILFRKTPVEHLTRNQLVIRVQPDEGISLSFGAKVPGPIVRLGTVDMDFQYQDYFGSTPSTGYERLLYDCMCGDATLFQRADMVETGWSIVAPVLDVWQALPPRHFPNYAAGTWGPNEADELMERDGREWRRCE
jgi:glucose-6-phosphate 1-dehydrogenase